MPTATASRLALDADNVCVKAQEEIVDLIAGRIEEVIETWTAAHCGTDLRGIVDEVWVEVTDRRDWRDCPDEVAAKVAARLIESLTEALASLRTGKE